MTTPNEGGRRPSNFVASQNRNICQTGGEQNYNQRSKGLGTRQCNSCVPPLPSEPSGLYSSLVTDSDLTLAKTKFVKMSGIGEVEFEPDRVDFVIQIMSIKPDIKEARESVKKRNDYIMAALKKYYIRDWEITSDEMVTRVEPRMSENDIAVGAPPQLSEPVMFKLTKEVNVHCDNLLKYRYVFSICHEKLDQFVVISEPIIKFSPAVMQLNTQRAIRQAVTNSQVKASELVGTLEAGIQKTSKPKLGQLIYSVEDYLTVQSLEEYENSNFESFKWKRLNKRVTCQITSVFEISDKLK